VNSVCETIQSHDVDGAKHQSYWEEVAAFVSSSSSSSGSDADV